MWLGAGAVVLVLLCCGSVALLPNEWNVNTSVVIDAPPEKIYPYVARPRQWVAIIERAVKKMPDGDQAQFTYTFGGEDGGAGSWWISETTGMGPDSWVRIEYTRGEPDKGLWYDGSIQQEEVNSHGSLTFEAVEGGTRVTWADTGTTSMAMGGGLAAMAIGPMLEPAFNTYLVELKDVVENETALEDAE